MLHPFFGGIWMNRHGFGCAIISTTKQKNEISLSKQTKTSQKTTGYPLQSPKYRATIKNNHSI